MAMIRTIQILVFSLFCFLLTGALPVKADYQAGLDAFGTGKFDEAYKEWKPLAEAGDPKAQHGLGLLYEMGKGVEKLDYAEAAKWYQLAAKQHFAAAENNLALLYVDGRGVQKDEKKAIELWQLAAEAGNPWAQFNLGNRYAQGWGVTKDDQKAIQYWQAAAEAGNGPASYNLGLLYYHKQDDESLAKAVKYFTVAAKSGLPEAQYAMGELSRQGKGVEHDLQKAVQWYQLAANNGSDLGRQRLEELAKSGVKPLANQDPSGGAIAATPDSQAAPSPAPHDVAGNTAGNDVAAAPPAVVTSQDQDQSDAQPANPPASATAKNTATPVPPLKEGIAQVIDTDHPSYHVWLGQKEKEGDAQTEWLKLYAKYPRIFSGIRADYRRFELGEQGTLFRLFAGDFATREDADALCAKLKKEDSNLFCRSVLN